MCSLLLAFCCSWALATDRAVSMFFFITIHWFGWMFGSNIPPSSLSYTKEKPLGIKWTLTSLNSSYHITVGGGGLLVICFWWPFYFDEGTEQEFPSLPLDSFRLPPWNGTWKTQLPPFSWVCPPLDSLLLLNDTPNWLEVLLQNPQSGSDHLILKKPVTDIGVSGRK